MRTPICDYVNQYLAANPTRLHMPGHKGRGPLGCEDRDITEIPGADCLFEADGIIAESERNASALFGCPTFYSTEGSSHCIRAMLFLAMQQKAFPLRGRRPSAYTGTDEVSPENRSSPFLCHSERTLSEAKGKSKNPYPRPFRLLAARNVHRSFLTAAALLDLDVAWLPTAAGSYLTADVAPQALDAALTKTRADAVYLTCPDYLGSLPDLQSLAEVCHAHGALLLVDNAHGAYLRFLRPSRHPMDLGADLCCDSAHKTLPVLTGGAYLHVNPHLQLAQAEVRDALALFGSTSPSYLILQSLDLANPFLERLPDLLETLLPKLDTARRQLTAAGYRLYGSEPLKLTLDLRLTKMSAGTSIACPPFDDRHLTGTALARHLEAAGVWCEFADPDFLVCMLTPHTTDDDLARLLRCLCALRVETDPACPDAARHDAPIETVCSIRTAMLAPCERIPAAQSLGRVLARPGVSCPPAVPIRMPGERIDEATLAAFTAYGIAACDVMLE